MDKDFEKRFLSPEQYNNAIKNDRRHYNCLAFAFGITDYEFLDFMLDDWFYPNIIEAFEQRARFYRIGTEKVENIDLIEGYGFILFGWVRGINRSGFHIARIEPDGQIVHKLGVKEFAGYTDFDSLLRIYKDEPHYFFKFTGECKPRI